MNFTEIVQQVVATTNRRDKEILARKEVNSALVTFSSDMDFPRDLEELLLPISVSDYTQSLSYGSFPRMRKIKYIRRAGTSNFLEKLDPDRRFSHACDMRDRWYEAGSGINISMTATASALDIGYYAFPPTLSNANPDHWMLEGNWPAITNRATAKVFADIGDEASSNKYERYAVADFLAFIAGLKRSS